MINENQQVINELINELEISQKENEELKIKINKLQEDKDKLSSELNKANKIISGLKNNQNNQQENNNIISSLNEIIKTKDKEIINLQNQLKTTTNIKKPLNSYNFEDIIVVHFISSDQKLNLALKCLNTDTFAAVEEKLYQQYEEYRETNNNFLANGKIVLRFKKILENNIKDGDKIQLINFE